MAYGYKVVKKFTPEGEAIRGDREIDETQAKIVQRIFREYALENKSPKNISSDLNADGIACPSGKTWGQSTINGNRKRGTGILNNHLYIGEMIWNRQRFIKDPTTGKRDPRFNSESEWIRKDLPELRIVHQDLWDAVKARQKKLDKRSSSLGAKKRPQYLLSGLLDCGECGGGYSKRNAERYGCSTSRNKGESVCKNKTTIKSSVLEELVLKALETNLMQDELVQVFCYGDLAGILKIASEDKAMKNLMLETRKLEKKVVNDNCLFEPSIHLVAGEGFEPPTFGL